MADNKVAVEITLEEKAALKALTLLTREIQKTEDSFTSFGKTSDNSIGKTSKSIKEAEAAFKKGLTSISSGTKATAEEIKNYEERTKLAAESSKSFFQKVKDGSSSAFGQIAGGVAVANLASTAIVGVANTVKDFVLGSVNAAIEQENAINRLNQSLKASGDFSQRASQDLVNFASSLQQVSIYGDEVIIGQIAVAKSFGASNDQAKSLVQAAANLSATFGGSLDSRVQQLGKTLDGTAGKLAKYVPELKGLSVEQLKAAGAADIINSKFSGAAANELNTYGGKLIAAKNSFSDLQEEMGRFVIENGYVTGALDIAKTSFIGLIAIQRAANTLFGLAGTPMQEQRKAMAELGTEYNALGATIQNLEKMKKASTKFGTGDESNLARIKELTDAIASAEEKRSAILEKRKGLRATDIADKQAEADANAKNVVAGGISAEDQKKIDSRKEANLQLDQIEADHQLFLYNQYLTGLDITAANREEELANLVLFEQQKIEAVYQSELQKNKAIGDSETKMLADKAAGQKKLLAMDVAQAKSEKTINDQSLRLEEQTAAAKLAVMGSTFALAGALAKDGSKEQFIIQKAAAAAQVVVATAQAMALAAATPPGLPVTAPVVAWAKANGAIQLATIAATAIKGFEQGGIVGGNSTTGDKIGVKVNSQEMILTRGQQSELWNIANGSGGGNNASTIDAINRLTSAIMAQPINVSVDGRAIATVIRKEVQSGFRIS